MPSHPACDITLLGSGLRALDHLTPEAIACLRGARVILHSQYSRDLLGELRALNSSARLLCQEDGEYLVGQYRPQMYARIAARVLAEAAEGPGVVALHPGSTMVVDAIARHVLAGAHARGLRVRVVPGISCIEYVLAELGWDVADGLHVILAQQLVLQQRRLDATQAALVIQPGYYDTRWFAGAPRAAQGRFDALQACLAASYPDDTPMALVLAPVGRDDVAQTLWFRLGSFAQLEAEISPFHTLFIPPRARPGVDAAFAQRIDSWDALCEQVQLDDYGLPRQVDPRVWFAGASTGEGGGVDSRLRAESERLAAAWPTRRAMLASDAPP